MHLFLLVDTLRITRVSVLGSTSPLVLARLEVKPLLVALGLLLVAFAASTFQRKVIYPVLDRAIAEAPIPGLAALIFLNNVITGSVYFLAFTAVYRVMIPSSLKRCNRYHTPECGAIAYVAGRKVATATILFLLLLSITTINTAKLLGVESPIELASRVASSIARLYGALEITGYLLLSLAPLEDRKTLSLALAGLMLVLAGALIEAVTLSRT